MIGTPMVKTSQETVKTAQMTIGVPIITCLPRVYQSSKTVKTAKMTIGVPIVTSAQSLPNTQSPRASAYTEYTKPYQVHVPSKDISLYRLKYNNKYNRPQNPTEKLFHGKTNLRNTDARTVVLNIVHKLSEPESLNQ